MATGVQNTNLVHRVVLQIYVAFGVVGLFEVIVGQDALIIDLHLPLVPQDQALFAECAFPQVLFAWSECLFLLFFIEEFAVGI